LYWGKVPRAVYDELRGKIWRAEFGLFGKLLYGCKKWSILIKGNNAVILRKIYKC
jgi:hypothetical protein